MQKPLLQFVRPFRRYGAQQVPQVVQGVQRSFERTAGGGPFEFEFTEFVAFPATLGHERVHEDVEHVLVFNEMMGQRGYGKKLHRQRSYRVGVVVVVFYEIF